MSARFRAISLDLWFTTLSFEPSALDVWRAAREEVLESVLVLPGNRPLSRERLRHAEDEIRRRPAGLGGPTDILSPVNFLSLLAEELGAELRGGAIQAGARYSDAGLEAAPPHVNPEAVALAEALRALDIPVVAITNTGRTGASWARFLGKKGGPRFADIITSCELGKAKPEPEIFREAARRLGLPCEEVLHVGDRWDIDVAGARASGMGRALYTGLWTHYPEISEREISLKLDDGGTDVLRFERLDQVLTQDLQTKS